MKDESKKIGLISMVLMGINGIVGSGIFLLPGRVMDIVGPWSLLVYAFVAMLVMSIAWCFAQCATIFNRNGGAYVYAKAAFGEFIGFEVGIMRWMSGIISWASIAVGLVTAISVLCPPAIQEPTRSILVLTLIGGLGTMNILGIRLVEYLNNIMTIAKLIPLLLLILIGSFFIEQAHFAPSIEHSLEIESFGAAALLIFYAFGGFESLTVAAEEMKNPKKNLPIAVMLAIGASSSLYFLIQTVSIGILGSKLEGSVTPLADVAEHLLGHSGKWIVLIAMLVSICGINIATSFITPRSGVALAENNMIPAVIAQKGRFGTPYLAIVITASLTALFALTGNFTQLVTISVVARFVQYLSTCFAVFVFHHNGQFPHQPFSRPWKLFIPVIAISGISWLLMQASLTELSLGLGAMVIAMPLYFVQQRYAPKLILEDELVLSKAIEN